jgi:hypothetical protein
VLLLPTLTDLDDGSTLITYASASGLKIEIHSVGCAIKPVMPQPTLLLQQRSRPPYVWTPGPTFLKLTLYLVDRTMRAKFHNGRFDVSVNGQPIFYNCAHGRRVRHFRVRNVQPCYRRQKRRREHAENPPTTNIPAVRTNECQLPTLSCDTVLDITPTLEDKTAWRLRQSIATVHTFAEELNAPDFLPSLI